MRKATATTVLFACFLAFAPASYVTAAPGDSTCQAAERDYQAAEVAADDAANRASERAFEREWQAAERDYERARAERGYRAARQARMNRSNLVGLAAYDRVYRAALAAAGEAIPARCSCLAAVAVASEAQYRAGHAAREAWQRAGGGS